MIMNTQDDGDWVVSFLNQPNSLDITFDGRFNSKGI